MRHIAHYPGQYAHPLLSKQGASIMDQQADEQDKNRSSDGYAIIVMYLTATEGVYDSGYTQESAAAAISMAKDEGRYQELLEDARAWLSSDKTSSRKTAVNFDFGDLTTINPDTGRFRSVYPEGGNPKYRGYNILELLEDALDNAVSFMPTISYQEPTTVTVTCVESGWSASVDASKEGWGLRLLEQAEAHDDDYMGKWLDENSDFSGYRASRKTATGEMSEADLTPDGEWGFWVQVADALGGTIHPFDKYQGPYIRYNGNRFWLVSDETGDFVYNETTDELRPSPLFFEDTEASDVAYIAEEIRDMARTSSRKTASHSLSFTADWKQDLNELNVIWQQAADILGVKAKYDPRYPNSYTIPFNGYELDLINDASGWRIYNQQTGRSLQADIYDLWDDENPAEWMADRVRELTGVPANKPIDWIDEWEGGTNTPWSWNASRTSSRKTAVSDPIESYKIISKIAKQCYEDFQQLQRNVEDAGRMYLDHKDMYEPNVRLDSNSRFEKEDIERARSVSNWLNEVRYALNDMPAKRFNSLMQHIQSQPYQSSRKTAEMSSSKHRYWRSKGYNIGAKVVANGYEPSDGDIEPLDGQFPGDSIPDVFGDDSDVEYLGGTLEEAIEAYEEGWWEAVEAARWDSDY